MRKEGIILVLLIVLLGSFVLAVPQTFNIHGKLTDSSGSALTGTYVMNFSIYDAPTGGNRLWNSGNQSITTDADGIYNFIITNINLDFSAAYYLGIKVEGDPEMTPRINLTSSPYTFRANVTDFLDSSRNYTADSLFANNYVGIGTTSPLGQFELSDTDTTYLYIHDAGVVANRGFRLAHHLDTWADQYFSIQGTKSGGAYEDYIYLQGNTGNVGIGTTTPGAKLHVNGSILSNSTINSTVDVCIEGGNCLSSSGGSVGGSGTADYISKWQDGINLENSVIFQNGSNIGIGTTNPGLVLHVEGSSQAVATFESTGSTRGVISFSDANTASNTMVMIGAVGNELQLITSGNKETRIDSEGKIGIGTTTPSQTLDVRGDGNFSGTIYINNDTDISTLAGSAAGWSNTSSTTSTDLNVNVTTGNITVPNGWVGIGTETPTSILDIQSTAGASLNVRGGGSNQYAQLQFFPSGSGLSYITYNNDLQVYSSKGGVGDVVRIDEDGNIGIGTTSPGAKLHVNGTGDLLNVSDASDSFFYVNGTSGIVRVGTIGQYGSSSKLQVGGNIAIYPSTGSALLTIIEPSASAYDFTFEVPSDGRLQIKNNNQATEVMTILQSGNVGIGTTSPSAKLEIANAGGGHELNVSDTLYVNATSGRVGIGTTGSQSLLHIHHPGTAGGDHSYARFSTGDSGSGLSDGMDIGYSSEESGVILVKENTHLMFGTNNDEKMRLHASGGLSIGDSYDTTNPGADNVIIEGNVGIGTSDPGARLHVNGSILSNSTINSTVDVCIQGGNCLSNAGAGGGTDHTNLALTNESNTFGNFNQSFNGSTLYIDADTGRVGIGDTTPDNKFEVWGGNVQIEGSANPALILSTSDNAGGNAYVNQYGGANAANVLVGGIGWGNFDGAWSLVQVANIEVKRGAGGAAEGYMAFSTKTQAGSLTEKMRIDPSGNVNVTTGNITVPNGRVGIGTESPSGDFHLLTSATTGDGMYIDASTVTTGDALQIEVDAATMNGGYAFKITRDLSDTFTIDEFGSVNLEDLYPASQIYIVDDNWIGLGPSKGRIVFDDNGDYVNVLDANVGIGTTSPSNTLDVRGDGNFSGTIYINNDTDISTFAGGGTDHTNLALTNESNTFAENQFMSKNLTVDGSTLFVDSDNARVGIGTLSPGYPLEINSSDEYMLRLNRQGANYADFGISVDLLEIRVEDNAMAFFTKAGELGIEDIDPDANLEVVDDFMVSSSTSGDGDLFTVLNTGNVGIGTTSPSKKLEVNGTSGGITFDPTVSPPVMNTTNSQNLTITSAGGSVIIQLG